MKKFNLLKHTLFILTVIFGVDANAQQDTSKLMD